MLALISNMTLKDILYVFIIGITVCLDICSAVTVTVDDLDVAEGSEARITCNIVPASSGAVPTVTWYNVTNGANDLIANYQGGFGTVEPGYSDKFSVENDITLVITSTLRSDSGTYQCNANLVGDSPSVDDDICTLTVNYLDKPEINFLTLVTEGDEVVMTCVVDSSPEAMCNFIKDGDVLPHDGSCTFTIPSVSRTDGGSYECEADNGVGNKQKSDNRNLEVEFKPVANDDNDINDQIVFPGETVTMTFSGIANPPDLTYLWTTDLPGNEDAVNNGSIFTVKVSESEVDDASYFVNLTVTNSIGSTTYSAKITISEPTPTPTPPPGSDTPDTSKPTTKTPKPSNESVLTEELKGVEIGLSVFAGICSCIIIILIVYCIKDLECGTWKWFKYGLLIAAAVLCLVVIIIVVLSLLKILAWFVNLIITGCVGIISSVILCIIKLCMKKNNKPNGDDDHQDDGSNQHQSEKKSLTSPTGSAIKSGKSSSFKVKPAKAEISTDSCLQVEYTLAEGEIVQHCDWYKCDKKGGNKNFQVRSGDANSRFTVADDGSLKIPNVKEDDDGHYCCEMTTSLKVLSFHTKFTVTNASKNAKSSSKKNKANVEPAIEMEEGNTRRYEAKSGDLYTEVNLKDKKKKQVEPEKDPSELYAKVDMDKKTKKPDRPAQVDKQSRNAEGLTYAELDLTRNLPKDTINHPDAETTYASIQQQPSRI